jgi:hypothetical protein
VEDDVRRDVPRAGHLQPDAAQAIEEIAVDALPVVGVGLRGLRPAGPRFEKHHRPLPPHHLPREGVEQHHGTVSGAAVEEALVEVSKLRTSLDPKTRVRAELQYERIEQLLELAKLGKRLLDTLLATAKIDAEPLVRFLLRQAGPASPP